MVHKFVKPKVSDYSNKLRVGLRRCHLEQKNYSFKFDGQIQVGTIDYFLIRKRLVHLNVNGNSKKKKKRLSKSIKVSSVQISIPPTEAS